MYRLIAFCSALLLGVIGCDQPGPIEVLHNDAREPVEVNLLLGKENDSLIVATEVQTKYDLTGVLQSEEDAYPAMMLVNGATYDFEGVNRTEKSYSRVAMRNIASPIPVRGNFGTVETYKHLDVGAVSLNGTALDRELVFLQIRSSNQSDDIVVPNGIRYKLLNDAESATRHFRFRPNIDYAVVAEGREVPSFTVPTHSPDEVTITHPKPYSLILSDEDLTLRWNGRPGDIVKVVISYYDETGKQVGKPIMELKSPSRASAMLISKKLLGLIPKTSTGKIVLTLVSANRKEVTIEGYSGKMLVQSASIHSASFTLK